MAAIAASCPTTRKFGPATVAVYMICGSSAEAADPEGYAAMYAKDRPRHVHGSAELVTRSYEVSDALAGFLTERDRAGALDAVGKLSAVPNNGRPVISYAAVAEWTGLTVAGPVGRSSTSWPSPATPARRRP